MCHHVTKMLFHVTVTVCHNVLDDVTSCDVIYFVMFYPTYVSWYSCVWGVMMSCDMMSCDMYLVHRCTGVQVDVIRSVCVRSGASVPVRQHAVGQRLPPTGSAGGSSGGHGAELRGAGGGDGTAIGTRPHPAATYHFLRPDGAAVQRPAQQTLC